MFKTQMGLVAELVLLVACLAACQAEAPITEKTNLSTPTAPTLEVSSTPPPVSVAPPPTAAAFPPPEAELHVIGIQAGAFPPGTDTRPWWKKCGGDPSKPPSAECHQRFAGQREKSLAAVNVTYTGAPVILALMGANPVEWAVNVDPGATVTKVILAGPYRQEIIVDRSIPVEVHGPHFSCESCTQLGGHGFAAYDESTREYAFVMRRLRELTGRLPSSVQLARQANGPLYVSSTLTHYAHLPETFRKWESPQ